LTVLFLRPLLLFELKYFDLTYTHSGHNVWQENINRLFRGSVQFNPEKLQAGGGSGLGLFSTCASSAYLIFHDHRDDNCLLISLCLSLVSKAILDLHGGSITVESPGENLGCTFTVCWPVGVAPRRASRFGSWAFPSTMTTNKYVICNGPASFFMTRFLSIDHLFICIINSYRSPLSFIVHIAIDIEYLFLAMQRRIASLYPTVTAVETC